MTQAVVKIAQQYQDEADSAQRVAEQVQAKVVRDFRPWLSDLTNDELIELAHNCGEEGSDDHCVYCVAWTEYINRGGE